jgi:hypothetical protein
MRRPLLRVLFFLGCAAMLVYGIWYEGHAVYPLNQEQAAAEGPRRISGAGFVEGATVDAYMRKEGQVYDVYSLSNAPVREKDCKT